MIDILENIVREIPVTGRLTLWLAVSIVFIVADIILIELRRKR